MSEDQGRQKILEAKKRLWETLSGQKQHAIDADISTTIGYRPISDVIRLNAAKKEMQQTLSGKVLVEATPITESTVDYRLPSGVRIASDVTPGAILRLNAAKRELDGTLSQLTAATEIAFERDGLIKTMQQGGGGIRNQTEDSGDTNLQPGEVAYSGGWEITGRGGRVTLATIAAEEAKKADQPTPIPAITSRQTGGQSDWSPSDAQGKDFPASCDDDEFDPDDAAGDLLDTFTGSDGRIRKQQAAKYFLNVNGDGSDRSHYAVPLAKMDKTSLTVDYHPEALENAWAIASGRDSGQAVRVLQNRVIRLKKKAGFDLTPDQADYQTRHMSAPSTYYSVDPSAEIDEQILKYDSQYTAALKSLQRTIRGKPQ
ncbi:MAG: hypothetical protein ABR985_08660 [Methanotrichaceae archaeon]|jgi:hypothetical protein